MLVNIDNEEIIEVLMRRLSCWTDDETTHKLYRQMYENYVECGFFDGGEFDIMAIVDNDYVNNCDVVSEGDEAYEGIKQLYEQEGICDISCEDELNNGFAYIEAEYNGSFLCRW